MSKGGVLLTSIQDTLSNVLYTVLYYLAVCSSFHEFLSMQNILAKLQLAWLERTPASSWLSSNFMELVHMYWVL